MDNATSPSEADKPVPPTAEARLAQLTRECIGLLGWYDRHRAKEPIAR